VTTEFWGNSGAADFPYVRLGSAVVEWGLAARESLAKFRLLAHVPRRNRMGECQVVLLNGYTPKPVGGQDFLDAINKYATVNDATAFSYMLDGHPFYEINFPTAGKSWLYDGATNVWSELQSDTGRHRANIATLYLGKTYCTDYSNGKIYKLDPTVYRQRNEHPARDHQPAPDERRLLPITQLWVDMETGVGATSGQGQTRKSCCSARTTWGTTGGRRCGATPGRSGITTGACGGTASAPITSGRSSCGSLTR
jgi:hypothetical protein